MKKFELWHGDCLELMKDIPDGSVDLVLTDPPYGTMKGIDEKHDWDLVINPLKMFSQIDRVLRPNGKVVLFSQQPFTTLLINNQIRNIPFCYSAIWEKDTCGNCRMAKSAMVSFYEDILIFSKRLDADLQCVHPLRDYFESILRFVGAKSCKEINAKLGHRRAEHCFYVKSTQFELCTNEVYEELIKVFGINKMNGFLPFDVLREINENYKNKNQSIFNLWKGGKSKSNVLEYKKDNGGYHPTQKPVALLEDLIQTYSNEGNTVLDFAAGSMSTVIACINTNRNCIAIEKDEHYFSVGCKRVHNHILDNNIDEGYFNIAKKRIEEADNDLP